MTRRSENVACKEAPSGGEGAVTERYAVTTIEENPALATEVAEVVRSAWPTFMRLDAIAGKYWSELDHAFPELQIAVTDAQSGEVVASAHAVPLSWNAPLADLPENGWDWALAKAFGDLEDGLPPNLVCGLEVSIAQGCRGKGLGALVMQTMKSAAKNRRAAGLVVPARPSLKSRYPLAAMASYVRWRNADGLPFDPWLRVHARQNGSIAHVCDHAMRIEGTVAQWEEWTAMRFPESGDYVVPDALVPVTIDCDSDRGVYVEPGVWVIYPSP